MKAVYTHMLRWFGTRRHIYHILKMIHITLMLHRDSRSSNLMPAIPPHQGVTTWLLWSTSVRM